MSSISRWSLALILSLFILIDLSWGFRISPPEFAVKVPTGVVANASQVMVMNTYDRPINVSVSKSLPLALRPGYQPIPNLEWISFEETHFRLDPGESKYITIYTNIPYHPRFVDQKYEVWLDFTGKEGFIVPMLSVRMLITTAGPPPGPLELVGIWVSENLALFMGILAAIVIAVILTILFTKYVRIEIRRR